MRRDELPKPAGRALVRAFKNAAFVFTDKWRHCSYKVGASSSHKTVKSFIKTDLPPFFFLTTCVDTLQPQKTQNKVTRNINFAHSRHHRSQVSIATKLRHDAIHATALVAFPFKLAFKMIFYMF